MQNPLENFSFTDPFDSWWPFVFAIIVGIVTALRSNIAGPTCPNQISLAGKTVVLTGGSRGIGLQVLIELVQRHATVYLATRDPSKAREIINTQIKCKRIKVESNINIIKLDLKSIVSIRRFVEQLGPTTVDILINNAGTAYEPFQLTEYGTEIHMAVNYLGPFFLTHLLLPKLNRQGARVIMLGADLHREGVLTTQDLDAPADENYSPRKAFARSKLALLLMARHLATQWQASNVTINVVDPGRTRGTGHTLDPKQKKMYGHTFLSWLLMKTPKQAAQTIIYVATAIELSTTSGRYFSNCSEVFPAEGALNADLARELCKKSTDIANSWKLIK